MAKPGDPASSGPPWWVTAASVLIIPVIITLITQFYSYQAQRDEALQKIQTATSDATTRIEALKSQAEQKSRELDIRMVEIALSLVKPDPNVDPTKIGAREWAIDVMERFSGIRFSPSARQSIIETAVPVEGIPKGAPTAEPAPGVPFVEPLGRDEFVVLDDPTHVTKWTNRAGNTIEFIPPVIDTPIKAITQNMRLLGGHIRLASTGAASSEEGFFNYLKIYGTPVKSGTCFNLVGLFATHRLPVRQDHRRRVPASPVAVRASRCARPASPAIRYCRHRQPPAARRPDPWPRRRGALAPRPAR